MRVVILCGGSGSRLWPLSRESLPKQFISMIDGKSLLDLTIERVLELNYRSKPIFICNQKHGFLVKKSIDKYNLKAEIFLEPESKNTCCAIYMAAKYCSKEDNLLIMPSDHLIFRTKKFRDDIFNIEKNLPANHWITLGIKPSKPSDAYGYIKVNKNKIKIFCEVNEFIEKPSKKVAANLVNDKNYFWNAGIFIVKSKTIIKSVRKHAPNIAINCDKAYESLDKNKITNNFMYDPYLFSLIPSHSIDYSTLEHEKNIYLYPFENDWNDLGSWDSLGEIINNASNNKNIIQIQSENNFIRADKRTIATIGVNNFIIIDSDNATLIVKKNHTEKVKQVVEKLTENNSTSTLEHTYQIRPWGHFENLLDDSLCKVKRLIINPKKRLSLQYHNFRSEHWLIVDGIANIYLDGKKIILKQGQSIDIPVKSRHYIENKTDKDLVMIETQLGSYFGEDDIIRIDDPYSR